MQLRKRGIDKVILAGMSANLCVESHMRELLEQVFEIAVVKDATAAAKVPEGIIDNRFPLIPNNGYTPEEFTCKDYLEKTSAYERCGGAIVSGSFQAFDQSYLIEAIRELSPSFVGVTQLPITVTDDEIIRLNEWH